MLIERLSHESGLRADRLRYFAETASRRYYVFSVPKATGGFREIAHPAKPLKAVQRWINSRYLVELPVHPCATAYRKGANIRDNAARHADTRFTLRVDFRDFFPNFSLFHVMNFVNAGPLGAHFTFDDISFLSKIACRHGGLTIGAPTSPVLTNAMMYEFDVLVDAYCQSHDLIYTRYADDLFISTNKTRALDGALAQIQDISASYPHANLVINPKKTAFLSKKYRRSVTGLVLTPSGNISIGRARKRTIKSLVHAWSLDQLAQDRVEYLRGLLSFASDVESSFIDSLVRKYGEETMMYLFMPHPKKHHAFSALENLDGQSE